MAALWKTEPVTIEKKECVEMTDAKGISRPVILVPFKGPHIQSPSRKYIHACMHTYIHTYIHTNPPKIE